VTEGNAIRTQGKYVHYEGNEFEIINMATHSETFEDVVIYRAIGDEAKLWVCPTVFWNQEVVHDGLKVKRFTHEDDIAISMGTSLPEDSVHKDSKAPEKIALFMSLFTGRTDVFAKRWVNSKTGKPGYSPDCYNFWKTTCSRRNGIKVKCGECPARRFVPFDDRIILEHFLGKRVVGVYPMIPDETCRFLAFDFDAKEYAPADLMRDVTAIREECEEHNVSVKYNSTSKIY